jgi:hypothetical protein
VTEPSLPCPAARRSAARRREFRRSRIVATARSGEAESPVAETALDAEERSDFVDEPGAPSSAGLDAA